MDNYIVSARKYRPTSFDSVVGQGALTTTLKNAIASGKLAHAYLFCGPRGVGKTTCARIFAKTINCLHPTPQGEACNACESCQAFNEQRSYNVNELDAASNNSVEDIRLLIDQVQVPPQIGRYKVFIIDEVHMLSQQAFNAFLKTLEEPPAHAIFILATTEKHKILPTILSRCQIYDFARMTVADTVKHLEYVAQKEGIDYEPEALHVIAEKADGGMRDALSIFDQVASFSEGHITYQKVIDDLNVLDYESYFAMTDLLLKCNVPQVMLRFNQILNRGFEGNYFIGGLASHFRNLLMSRDEATLPLLDVSQQVRERYHEQALRCQPRFLYRALKLCNDCDINYRTSRNKRLLVEITLIEVAQAAVGDDDTGCGRRPARRLKPLFSAAPVRPAAAAPAPRLHPAPVAAAAPAAQTPAAQTSAPQVAAPAAVAAEAAPQPAPVRRGRVVPTLSIRKLQQQLHAAPAQAATSAPEAATAAATHQELPFNDDQLMYQWFSFAQRLPKEHTAMKTRLKGMQPKITEGWCIVVPLENELVEAEMSHLLPQLVSFLRINLSNDAITVRLKIAEGDEVRPVLGRAEQFKSMLQRNKGLSMLRESLSLELT